MQRRRNGRLLTVVLVVALVTAACSGSDEAGESPPGGGGLVTLLERLPTGAGGFFVTGVSLEHLAEQVLGSAPDCTSDEELIDWFVRGFADEELYVHGPQLLRYDVNAIADLPDVYGVSICDADWFVDTQSPPSPTLLSGDFDVSRIDEAVRADENWSDVLRVDGETDVEYYDWSGDGELRRPTALRPLGIGGQLALFEEDSTDVVAITSDRSVMLDVIEAEGRSVADNRFATAALSIVEAAEPISVLLTNEVPRLDAAALAFRDIEQLRGELDDPKWLLERYELLAVAQTVDEIGELIEVVLVHDDAIAAEANLERLERMIDEGESIVDRRPWSDRLVLESLGARDDVLVARLRGAGQNPPFRLLVNSIFQRDTLFATS